MMEIVGKTQNGQILLQTTEPVNGKKQTALVNTQGDAMRLAYYWNRCYVYEKLTNWLKMRIYAFKLVNDHHRITKAASLLYMLSKFQAASLESLTLMVYMHRDLFEFIAPGEKSN